MKIEKLKYYLWLPAAFILLAANIISCGRPSSSSTGLSLFTDTVYSPEYASGFVILGSPDSKSTLINVSDPWQGADSVVSSLLILRNGENPPAQYQGAIIKGDAKRIVAMSSTHIAMLDAIGETDKVVGLSGINFISNPRIQARKESPANPIADIGFDGNVDYELLLSLQPDLVLLYGVNSASPMETKLKSLGVPYLYIGDYLEESPLGKAEWMVLLGEITGNRAKAQTEYAGIPQRYMALKKRVSDAAPDAPTVMLNTPYNDSWFMPSTQSYLIRLIEDAGGRYIYDKNTGTSSVPISMEEALALTSRADIWINPGNAGSLKEVAAMCPKFTSTRCFRNGDVFNNNLRSTPGGGNDAYESAIVNPDLMLRDLIKIFHPEIIEEPFVYYQRLR